MQNFEMWIFEAPSNPNPVFRWRQPLMKVFKANHLTLTLILTSLLLPASLSAQTAFGVPSGNRIIEVDLSYPTDHARVEVREGELIRIRFAGANAYALQPHFRGEAGETVEFVVYEVASRPDGAERVREVQRFDVAPGLLGRAETNPPIDVRLEGVRVGTFKSTAPEIPQEFGSGELRNMFGASGVCCIYCKGVMICACSVQTSCGSCCSDSCCSGDDDRTPFEPTPSPG
jgi:hypothetical protein